MWWDPLADLENEHPGLVTGTLRLMELLDAAPAIFGDYAMDPRFVQRAKLLHGHLDSIGVLLERTQYPSAFSLVRTAFEHAFIDRLLLTATKRRVRHENVDRHEEERLRAAVLTVPGLTDIDRVYREGKDVLVERDAQQVRSESGDVVGIISPYFFVLDHHNPVVGRKSDQADRVSVHLSAEEQGAAAERNANLFRDYLRWSAVLDNLVLNGWYSKRDAGRLQAHYAFLSAFGHPLDYGYSKVDHDGHRCFLCSELAVLYMGTLAALELAALVQHCARRMPATDVDRHVETIERVNRATAHLWFPPGQPSAWDRHQVVLQMHGMNLGTVPFGRPVIDPSTLTDEQIPYYSDPLDRLIALHHSASEMVTGLAYNSPWPHPQLPIHP